MKKFKHLLISQWISVNIFGIALLGTAYVNGWVDLVRSADPTGITELIFVLFMWGWVLSAQKAWYIGKRIDKLKAKFSWVSSNMSIASIEALKLKIINKIAIIKWFSGVLVILGLIGTVIGFIIALSGVDVQSAGDVGAIGPMVSTLIKGMQVALYTTLVGSVFHIWLHLNYYILSSGASTLISTILGQAKDD